MKENRRLFGILMVVVIIMTFCLLLVGCDKPDNHKEPAPIPTVVDDSGVSYEFNFKKNAYEVVSFGKATKEQVVIKDAINGFPVISIISGKKLKDDITSSYIDTQNVTKSVTIPSSVKYIQPASFYELDMLSNIKLPDDDDYPYDIKFGCLYEKFTGVMTDGYGNIEVPEEVVNIPDMTLFYHGCVKSVKLPGNNIRIGRKAFANCSNLKEIYLGDLQDIPAEICTGSGLTKVSLDRYVSSIGKGAFSGCGHLRTIAYHKMVDALTYSKVKTAFGEGVLHFPRSLKTLSEEAFRNTDFDHVVLYENIETIGKLALSYKSVDNYPNLYIEPDSIPEGWYIYIPHNHPFMNSIGFTTDEDFMYIINASDDMTARIRCTIGEPKAEYTIPGKVAFGINEDAGEYHVNEIAGTLFKDNTLMTKLEIPDTIEMIDARVAINCPNVKYLKTPFFGDNLNDTWTNSLSYIIDNEDSRNISEVVVTKQGYIDDDLLFSLKDVADLHLLGDLRFVDMAFVYKHSNIINIFVKDIASWCALEKGSFGDFYSADHYVSIGVNGEVITDLVLPADLPEIKKYSFYNNPALLSVTTDGQTLGVIDEYAFANNPNLQSVTLGDVKKIYPYAFANCANLGEFSAKSVVSMLSKVFMGDMNIVNFSLPCIDYLSGDYTYGSNIPSLYIPPTVSSFNQYDMAKPANTPLSWESLALIAGTNKLSGINYNDNVMRDDETYDYVVVNDEVYLTRIHNMTNEVTIIPDEIHGKKVVAFGDIFSNNNHYKSIKLGRNIKYLSSDAFANCANLERVDTSPATNLVFIGKGLFYNTPKVKSFFIPKSVKLLYSPCSDSNVESIYVEAQEDAPLWEAIDLKSNADVYYGYSDNGAVENSKLTFVLDQNENAVLDPHITSTDDIKEVVIPDYVMFHHVDRKVVNLVNNAFNGNPNITKITLPEFIDNIDGRTFRGLTGLKEVVFSGKSKYKVENNCIVDTTTNKLVAVFGAPSILPDVATIGSYAFVSDNTPMTAVRDKSIIMPSSITRIESYAFKNIRANEIVFTSHVRAMVIEKYAFIDCANVNTVQHLPVSATIDYAIVSDDYRDETPMPYFTVDAMKKPEHWSSYWMPKYHHAIYLKDTEKQNPLPFIHNGVRYYIHEDHLQIIRQAPSLSGKVEIPSELKVGDKLLPVTSARSDAFDDTNITHLVLPDSMTQIPKFAGLNSLVSIKLPNNLTIIGDNTFDGCSSLEEVKIGNGTKEIGYNAFAHCPKLKVLTIPASVESGNQILDGTDIEKIYIESDIHSVDLGISSYVDAEIIHTSGNKVESTYINKGNVVYKLANGKAYIVRIANTREAKDIYIEDGFTIDGVTYTTTYVTLRGLENFKYLETLRLPNINESIEKIKFTEDRAFKSFIVDADHPLYYADGKCLYAKSNNYLVKSVFSDVDLTKVPGICSYALSGTSDLSTIDLYYEMKLEPFALAGMKRLSTIIFREIIESISEFAFAGCPNLINISIPQGLKYIGKGAFANCPMLRSVTLPKTIVSIGVNAFYDDISLSKINLENVKSIDEYAFYNCRSLTDVNLSSAETINKNAFENAIALCNVYTSEKLSVIGSKCFVGCRNLTFHTPLATASPKWDTTLDAAWNYYDIYVDWNYAPKA